MFKIGHLTTLALSYSAAHLGLKERQTTHKREDLNSPGTRAPRLLLTFPDLPYLHRLLRTGDSAAAGDCPLTLSGTKKPNYIVM